MDNAPWQLELTRPAWLAVLVVLPLVVYYSRRSLVHFGRRQRAASLVARIILIALLAVALCDLKVTVLTKQLFVVFAFDTSQSISPKAAKAAEDFIGEAAEHTGENRSLALPFAAEVGENADRTKTNLAAVIAAAQAAIPSTYVPRIVLLSDGNQTAGDALAAAKAAGVPISTVFLAGLPDHEVYVSAVETPGQVHQGEPFDVAVVVQSTHEDEGRLQFLHGSEVLVNEQRRVTKGENRFHFRQSVKQQPAATLTARIDGFKDTLKGNNQAAGVVCTPAKIRVLLVEDQRESGRPLTDVLKSEGIDVTVRSTQDVPGRLDELLDYELLVLSNVPAASLPAETVDVVEQYVRDSGGGLIVVGGDRAFTSGEYHDTKLEEILPVLCQVKRDRPKPPLAMVLVIDQSDSMKKGNSIELAKTATWLAVERLGPGDQVGVIAFEDKSRWVSELRSCSDEEKEVVRQRIKTIIAGGGTNMYPAMEKAYLALNETFAELKHMIVLSDGVSHPGDFETLTKEIAASGITVSTVALGREAVPELLRGIAQVGKGRFYACDDPADVPQVFTLEATSAGKVGIVEKPVSPQVVDFAEVFPAFAPKQVPRLLGYVETLPKADGRLVMAAENGDPLLIWWRYGRGVSVAFTSDVNSNWAPLWLEWPGLGRFWAELVRHAMRKDDSGDFALHVLRENDRAYAILDAADPQNNYLNGGDGILKITDPDGRDHLAPLRQIAPGRYAAEFAASTRGAYYLETTLNHRGGPICRQRRGLVIGYADELRVRPANEDLLQSIAMTTGGQHAPEPAAVFAPPKTTVPRTTLLWPYLLMAAGLVFLIDVTLRRVDLGRTSLPRSASETERRLTA